jgi:predicted DNA-binding ribbon-helix-helix protein
MATMAVDTATIRVARDTRDLLAQQARERGMSLAALLAEIAHERELEAIFASERRARLAEDGDPEAEAEMRLWETTLEDGLDFD